MGDEGVSAGISSSHPTSTWKNHGAYVSCVSNAADALYRAGKITSAQKGALVSAAAQSNVGKKK